MTDLTSRFAQRSDLHQSPMHLDLMREIGWQVASHKNSHIFYRKLGPLSIAKIQRPTKLHLNWITKFRKTHRTLLTYIEAGLTYTDTSTSRGFMVEPYAHSCTSLVDLSPNSSKILANFSQKTRYNITHNLRKNNLLINSVEINKLSPIQYRQFFALHSTWSKRKNVIGHPIYLLEAVLKCYGKSGDLHLCYRDHELVGSLLILYHDSVATYYTALATDSGYQLYAPTILTWTAMQTAKTKNCDIFDFGGIYDPRYPKMYKNWQGFTKFKSGFHPEVVSYPKTTLQLFW